jgi:hypothetical protein
MPQSFRNGSVANFSGFYVDHHWSNAWFLGEADRRVRMVIDFMSVHYPKVVILYAVFFYVRYAVSYRDLEEILAERGVAVDHATLNRWVVKYSPQIEL